MGPEYSEKKTCSGTSPRYRKLTTCRIVRDYEKYLARQFKRGTSRQELNVSWLKKNEIDLKRHVQELRENITNNWTSTGSELSRELRGYWPASRPQSPARFSGELARSPGGGPINSKELVTGYALGLVGGVRSWVRYVTLLGRGVRVHDETVMRSFDWLSKRAVS
jgi:hypothetical protein